MARYGLDITKTIVTAASGSSGNLTIGSSGAAVSEVQGYLINLGYLPPNTLDGIFGPATQQAVRDFQRNNGLTVDGIVGPNTRMLLGSRSARTANDTPALPSGTEYTPSVGVANDSIGPGPSTRIDFTEGSTIIAQAPSKVKAWWAGMTPVGKAFTVSLGLGVGLLVFGGGKKR